MRTSARKHHYFDTRSVLLFAALGLGGAAAMQAYAADGKPGMSAAGSPQATAPAPVQLMPPTAATSQKNPTPPLSTSPAFGPDRASGNTGGANQPSQRPEIKATAPSAAKTAFDRADADKDGRLSAKEAQMLPAMSERFKSLDTNHDGHLSRAEFDAGSRS